LPRFRCARPLIGTAFGYSFGPGWVILFNTSMDYTISRLSPENTRNIFDQIAFLHIGEIHHGILPLLGSRFLSALYREMSGSTSTGVWCAMNGEKVAGFISGSANLRLMYKRVLLHGGIKLIFSAGISILSPKVLKNLGALVLYPFRTKQNNGIDNGTEPELLSIVVAPEARSSGIGRSLVQSLEAGFREWGTTGTYRVTTNIEETASNAFYKSLGFKPVGTLMHHKLTLQVYEKSL